jgi:hypothetical protein
MNVPFRIQLLPDWRETTPPGQPWPRVFYRQRGNTPGPLQVSFSLYRGGPEPRPTPAQLREMAIDFGTRQGFGELLTSGEFPYAFGVGGTAVFRSPKGERIQVWFLSDGRNFALATHFASGQAEPAEVEEAAQIVAGIAP